MEVKIKVSPKLVRPEKDPMGISQYLRGLNPHIMLKLLRRSMTCQVQTNTYEVQHEPSFIWSYIKLQLVYK